MRNKIPKYGIKHSKTHGQNTLKHIPAKHTKTHTLKTLQNID